MFGQSRWWLCSNRQSLCFRWAHQRGRRGQRVVRPLGLLGEGLVIDNRGWRRGMGLRGSSRAFGDGDTKLGEGKRLSSGVVWHAGWIELSRGFGGADCTQKWIVWARRRFCFLRRRLGKCGRAADWKLGLGGDWSIGEWIVSLAYGASAVREWSWKNVCWWIDW